MPTAYHSQYWAHALTLRGYGGSVESLSRSIANARVDLNPHQVDAALFALRSPLTDGAILADEVGLTGWLAHAPVEAGDDVLDGALLDGGGSLRRQTVGRAQALHPHRLGQNQHQSRQDAENPQGDDEDGAGGAAGHARWGAGLSWSSGQNRGTSIATPGWMALHGIRKTRDML